MKFRFFLVVALLLSLVFGGCGKSTDEQPEEEVSFLETSLKESDMFTDNDFNTSYQKKNSIQITLNENSISCNSNAVKISGTTIVIQEEGTYVFTGTLNDGMILINADKDAKPHLILDNASISNSKSAPLCILEAEKVFVTLAKNTENALASGDSFATIENTNVDGTIFSKQDLTLNGSGKLSITSPAGHGIVCKDDLVFTGGSYSINCASHGMDANDSVRITDSSFNITSGKDGIHVENNDDESLGFAFIKDGAFQIIAEGDGISSSSLMQVNNGDFDITSGGGSKNAQKATSDGWGGFPGGGFSGGNKRPGRPNQETYSPQENQTTSEDTSTSIKGLKSVGNLLIQNGTFTIDSADDAVHSNANISIGDGKFKIASGDDGFHADDTLLIQAGTIDISKSYEGLEGLHIQVKGGTIKLIASDDGLNAAGGTDESGTGGYRGNDQFGPRPGGMGGSSSNGSISISGGTLYIQASGDGLDANGTIEITGGNTQVCGPTRGDTAVLDYDKSGSISNATFVGTGSTMMAQTLGSSTQGVIFVRGESNMAKTTITLKDAKGNTVLSVTPALEFQLIVLSGPEIKKGETYTLEIGTTSRQVTAN